MMWERDALAYSLSVFTFLTGFAEARVRWFLYMFVDWDLSGFDEMVMISLL